MTGSELQSGRPSNDELRKLMDEEAAAAEAEPDEDDGLPLPPHVKVSRPGWEHRTVLEVSLNPEELDALEAIAAQRDLPVRTIAREQLLRLIAEQQKPVGRRTAEDYEAAAADYAANPLTADEIVGSVEIGPGLRKLIDDETSDIELRRRLDLVAAEAEAAQADQTDRPIPPHVKVSRPNRPKD